MINLIVIGIYNKIKKTEWLLFEDQNCGYWPVVERDCFQRQLYNFLMVIEYANSILQIICF